ncbi:MAG: acylphosphatase, partial [Acidobacteriota bacterium]|nr:acylphosphatase [Acidobacteriota bacterium]
MAPALRPARPQLEPVTIRKRVHISGIVQGIGFRPFLYRLALRHHLTGFVRNTS